MKRRKPVDIDAPVEATRGIREQPVPHPQGEEASADPMTQFSVYIPRSVKGRLEAAARAEMPGARLGVGALVRVLIEEGLLKREGKAS